VFRGKVRAILNKLTPEKFDRLFDQVMDLGISDDRTLCMMIDEIFDKALGEVTFCSMYAELCLRLSKCLPEFVDDEGNKMAFRRLLLNKCQMEFEKEKEIEQIEDEFLRVQLKRRMLGNIHFIGELYLKRMLVEGIMYFCIKKLLGDDPENPDAEDIEALCKLLSTIGGTLEHATKSKKQPHLDLCFNQLQEIKGRQPPVLGSRYCFMIADLFDLRKNNWVPRNKSIGPTTIAKVHAEPNKPKDTAHLRRKNSTDDLPTQVFGGNRGGRPGLRLQTKNSAPMLLRSASDPGHQASGLKASQSSQRQLRSRSPPSPTAGGDGWEVAGRKKGGDDEEWETAGSTRAGRKKLHDRKKQDGNHQSSSSRDGRNIQPKQSSKLESTQAKNSNAPRNAFGSLDMNEDEEEEVGEDEGDMAHPETRRTEEACMDKSEMEKKTNSMLNEFLASNDEEEAAMCVSELGCAELHDDMVVFMIIHVMEKKESERAKVDKLLSHLVSEKVIMGNAAASGITKIMGMVGDLTMDVPKFGNYIARTLGLVMAADGILPSTLKDILAPLEGSTMMAKMLIWIMDAIQQTDDSKAKTIFVASEMSLVNCMPEGDQTHEAASAMIEQSNMKMGHMMWMCGP